MILMIWIRLVETHSQSFFGKSTGITVQSTSRTEPYIFLRCIQKKPDGSWEKPSRGEGKVIRCSLDEIVMILQVLRRKIDNWSSYHKYKGDNTQISFKWIEGDEQQLFINVGKYSKMLNYAQVQILVMLLDHLLIEKIEYATVPDQKQRKKSVNTTPHKQKVDAHADNGIPESIESNKVPFKGRKSSSIKVKVKRETEKALLLEFNEEKAAWIPKSCIKSPFDINNHQKHSINDLREDSLRS
jgi:hypothetical protein